MAFRYGAAVTVALGLFSCVAFGALPHEAYIWQREWTPTLTESAQKHGPSFTRLVYLSAELSLDAGKARLARVQPDYRSLMSAKIPIGLALRIGPCPESLMRAPETPRHLAALASGLLDEARKAGLEPSELQVDFDCAESKLGFYRKWVEEMRSGIAPVPLVITVLPCWLSHDEFAALASAADSVVLQVHSLAPPKSPGEMLPLCDPQSALTAAAKMAEMGVTFRVALPTYGYLVAFDANGKYIGLAADDAARLWPAGSRTVELRAEAPAMAELVRHWTADTPKNMTGIIWYRLPAGREAMNWPWETLQAVMQGRVPKAGRSVTVRRNADGLIEVDMANTGETEMLLAPIELKWKEAHLRAADGLNGYELVEGDSGSAFLRPPSGIAGQLLPGQCLMAGWLRLDREVEVDAYEVQENK